MSKNVTAVLVLVIIVVFGGLLAVLTLQRTDDPEPAPSPSPTPVVLGSYQLEGRITAASTAALVSPSPRSREVESGVTGTIDVRLSEIRGDFDGCVFEAGEVAVVRIVDATVFDPPTLISSPSFPDNLIGEDIESTGTVLKNPDGECHLVADRIDNDEDERAPSGGATPTPTRGEATASPTPRQSPTY